MKRQTSYVQTFRATQKENVGHTRDAYILCEAEATKPTQPAAPTTPSTLIYGHDALADSPLATVAERKEGSRLRKTTVRGNQPTGGRRREIISGCI